MLRPLWARRARLRRQKRDSRIAIAVERFETRLMLSAIGPGVNLKDGPLGALDGNLVELSQQFATFQTNSAGASGATFQSDNPLVSVTDDRVLIDTVASEGWTAELLAGHLTSLGMDVTGVIGRVVSGYLPIARVEAAGKLASLQFARPFSAMTMVGSTTSQADSALRADDVRSTFTVDGSGLTVGVLSDSYDMGGDGSAAADIASGDLPGAGNPLGNTTPVNVIQELSAPSTGIDEGRAMLQLIHDLAPGANLAFHTAFDGLADFAQGIIDLQVAGSDVIVDDVIYFAEPMFQDGLIAQSVDQVVAAGVPYFSSAGNSAQQSWEDFNGFNPSGTFGGPFGGQFHDFDPGGGVDILQQITVPVGTSVIFSFQWDQPFATSGGAGSASDVDFFLYNDAPVVNLAAPLVVGGDSNTGGDAVEVISFTNDGTIDVDGVAGADTTFNLAINHFSGPFAGALKYVYFSSSVTINEFANASATSYGHANAAGASSVGAAFYGDTPEFGQPLPPLLEPFSSLGGIDILFDTAGNLLAMPEVRQNVDIVSVDGTNTTFFGNDIGFDPDAFPNFFGTSAAAPHAAAVAALMLEANGGAGSATPAQVYSAMESSAINMGPAGYDALTGHGLLEGVAATNALLNISAGSISGTKFEDLNTNGFRDAGEPGLADWTIFIDANGNGVFDSLSDGVEPDDFAPGTNLGNINPNVTLSEVTAAGAPTGAPIVANNGAFPSTGVRTFAGTFTTFGQSNNSVLRIDFNVNVTSVSIDAISDDASDFGLLQIFDAGDNLLDTYVTADLSTGQFETMTLNSATPIAYAQASGQGGQFMFLDNLVFSSAEQSTTTDANGDYSFPSPPEGTHQLGEVLQPGWIQTAPNYGRLFAVDDATEEIFEIDPATGVEINRFAHPGVEASGANGLAFNGTSLFFTDTVNLFELNPNDGTVLDTDTLASVGTPATIDALAYFGGQIAALDFAGDQVFFIDYTSDSVTSTVTLDAAIGDAVGGMTGASSRGSLFVTDLPNNLIYEVNASTGAIINSFGISVGAPDEFGLAFVNGSLFVGDNAGNLTELDPNTGAPIGIGTVAFPGANLSALGGDDGLNGFWNVFVGGQNVTGVNFGNFFAATDDFGDAPTAAQSGFASSYPTLLADGGARHGVLPGFHLGTNKDLELDGIPTADADGDDMSQSPDDEDGVTFFSPFAIGREASFDVDVTNTAGVSNPYLDIWLDNNRDGDWNDFGEQIFSGQVVAGTNTINFVVSPAAIAGQTYARFRLHDGTTGLSPAGAAADGEVEDYAITLEVEGQWNPLGPFSATDGQVENVSPNDEIVGAVHTVLAHPTNPDVLYIGGTNGGVWRTDNATSASPNWIPLTDDLPSQSIGAMTWDLADATNQTIYAGIGRYSSYGRIGNDRIGLLRTTDGGSTWNVVDGGGTLVGKNISGIHVNGNTIVVSVNIADNFFFSNIGIFRSTDGGATFNQISNGDGTATGLPGGVSYDLFADPTNANTLYTSAVFADDLGGQNGIYKSTDQGATWAKVSNAAIDALVISGTTSNLELAVGNSNNVYASVINVGMVAGLFRSGDGGATWVQMDTPTTNENGTDVGLNPGGGKGPGPGASPEEIAGGQGAIHFSIVADPNDANIVYVGGDRQPLEFQNPTSIGATDFSGRLFRGDASQPAGSQWVHLTHSNVLGAAGGGTANSSAPHADSREMVFDANGDIIEVDDGGVYRRTNPTNNTGDWFSINGDLQVTEAHDVTYDAISNVIMTGNQDTGTTYQPFEGATLWDSLSTADGGDVAVDEITLAGSNQSIRYSSFQNLGAFRRTTWDAAGSLLSTVFPALTVVGGGAAFSGAFRTPVELNSIDPTRLIIQGGNSTYESLDQGDTISEIGAAVNVSGISQNAIAYGGFQGGVPNQDVLWVGSGDDVYFRSGPGSLALTNADPTSQTIRDLAIDPDDWATAFVIDQDQVFSTSNEGGLWSDITGNLLNFVSELRSIAYVAGPIVDALVVGTNLGIFASATTALGSWIQLGSSLPNVLVYDMEYDVTDDVLVAGTLGRGAWLLGHATSFLENLFTAPRLLSSHANNFTHNRAGIGTLELNFTTPVMISATADLNLFNHTTSSFVDISAATVLNDGAALIRLNMLPVGGLPNGRYTLEVPTAAASSVATGLNLTQTTVFQFHKLAGDVTGDGLTNSSDFVEVDANFDPLPGTPFKPGDASGDGLTNSTDFVEVDANFDPIAAGLGPALVSDFGDAPDPTFPTTLANSGAEHLITGNTLLLGATRDDEADGQPTADATGDGADEDGVVITGGGGALETETAVAVDVTASEAGVLNAWIDYNQDGDWDDAGEQVFTNLAVAMGVNNLMITAPAGAAVGMTIARFRLTSTAGYSYFGTAFDGEVEDYQITINDNLPPSSVVDGPEDPPEVTAFPAVQAASVQFADGAIQSEQPDSRPRQTPPIPSGLLALPNPDQDDVVRSTLSSLRNEHATRLSLIAGDQPQQAASGDSETEPDHSVENPFRNVLRSWESWYGDRRS